MANRYFKTGERPMSDRQIIEINGVRFSVDPRNLTEMTEFSVGDPVKLVFREFSSDKELKIYPGIIIGFHDIVEQPTAIIAYLKYHYFQDQCIKFLEYNKYSIAERNISLHRPIPAEFQISRDKFIAAINNEIAMTRDKIDSLERQLELFKTQFEQKFNFNGVRQ